MISVTERPPLVSWAETLRSITLDPNTSRLPRNRSVPAGTSRAISLRSPSPATSAPFRTPILLTHDATQWGPTPQANGAIHRSAWKGNSQKSISTILHSLPLWEQRMAYFSILELKRKGTLGSNLDGASALDHMFLERGTGPTSSHSSSRPTTSAVALSARRF